MTEYEILIIDGKEALCRWEMVKEARYDFPTLRAVPVITKDEFLTCFNAWIRGKEDGG